MATNTGVQKEKTRLTRLIKLHGKNEPFPANRTLKAGALVMQYENGAVRNIRLGGTEIIRMIYAAVRDQHWLTLQPEITNEKISKSKKGFRISFDACYQFQKIDFRAGYIIEANSEGHFFFEMKGRAFSTFWKNRIGFCVLHPVDPYAGSDCRITHPDGSQNTVPFPITISPHQPFGNIASMQWKINDNADAILRFYGDVFETEDQRNWTDASYKTYGTPLGIPYPVEVKQGTMLYQKIELNITGALPDGTVPEKKVAFQINTEKSSPLPPIGTCLTSRQQPLSPGEALYLKNNGFSHIRAELHVFNTNFENQFDRILHESSLLGLPVELCLLFDREPETGIQLFLQRFRRDPLRLKSIILLSLHEKSTPCALIETVAPVLRKELPGTPLGAGTNCNFAQLNRSRPDPGLIDFITFAIHPQEHASDDKSLFENAAAQQDAVQSAHQFEGRKPVYISPITLQRRFNANTGNFEVPAENESMPSQVDVRQMSLAGAAWTTVSLKYLMESGVDSVSYYETIGERGLLMGDYASRWPIQFPAIRGMLFPVFHVFRMLLRFADSRIVHSTSNKPLVADGFSVISGDYGLIFMANLTLLPQQVEINGISNLQTLLIMNEDSFARIVKPTEEWFTHEAAPVEPEESLVRMLPYETRILRFSLK